MAEEQNFINEKIVSKKKRKIRKRIETIAFVVIMAAVFGVVARLVFALSGDVILSILGIEPESNRQEVNLLHPTGTAMPDKNVTVTEASETNGKNDVTEALSSGNPDNMSETAENREKTVESEKTENTGLSDNQKGQLEEEVKPTQSTENPKTEQTPENPQKGTTPEVQNGTVDTKDGENGVGEENNGGEQNNNSSASTGTRENEKTIDEAPSEEAGNQSETKTGQQSMGNQTSPELAPTYVENSGATDSASSSNHEGKGNDAAGSEQQGNMSDLQNTMDGTIASYFSVYQEIIRLSEKMSRQLVSITSIEESVDWFQEVYQTKKDSTGLVVANDGVDLLILTEYERVQRADSLEVEIASEKFAATLFSYDKNCGIAIVAVPLAKIPEKILNNIDISLIASEKAIQTGTPIIALGAPNGYLGSMEFGMITSLGGAIAITDGQIKYFTTNLPDYAKGHGFIVSLNGEILGMMTQFYKSDTASGISCAISLDTIRGIIVKLLNKSDYAYMGIKGADLPKELKTVNGVDTGVYIKEVEVASPALNAGVKTGDILIAANEKKLTGIQDLNQFILSRSSKEVVRLTLLRKQGNGMKQVEVELMLLKRQ